MQHEFFPYYSTRLPIEHQCFWTGTWMTENQTPRKPPTAWVVKPDELQRFKQVDTKQNLKHIDTTCIKSLGKGFTSLYRNGRLIFFKLKNNISNVPEVTHCIDVSTDLRVKLYFKIIPVPLLKWFSQGRNTFLTSKAMIVNFISYLSERSEEQKKNFWKKLIALSIMSDQWIHSIWFFSPSSYVIRPCRHIKWKGRIWCCHHCHFLHNFTHDECLYTKLVLCFINMFIDEFVIQRHPTFSTGNYYIYYFLLYR